MEFSITDLLDYDSSVAWIVHHIHAGQLKCPRCHQPVTQARLFRRTRRSDLTVYRCTVCGATDNWYSNTVFQQAHLTPMQVVPLLRGFSEADLVRAASPALT